MPRAGLLLQISAFVFLSKKAAEIHIPAALTTPDLELLTIAVVAPLARVNLIVFVVNIAIAAARVAGAFG